MSTTRRPFNFSAGPAAIPEAVLREAAAEMLDWHGSGMSVMEMSHRGPQFGEILHRAESDLRTLLNISDDYAVLFMQGGAIAENAIVPLNLSRGAKADYAVTGSWSQKSQKEARKYCDVHLCVDAGGEGGYGHIPDPAGWSVRRDAQYLHVCTNETIDGVEFHAVPDSHGVPLVADMSSHILSREVDVSRYACIYAGAQKNIGPAGLTLIVIRRDLLGHALPVCPSAFDYATVAANGSMYNTPPTYAIYIAGLVFQWLLAQEFDGKRGLAAVEARNVAKAKALYDALDASCFYETRVDPACRSRMNVPFHLANPDLQPAFLQGADAAGLLQLKGHKSVGGLRASIYNAMSLEGVSALVDYLRDFETRHA